MLLWFNLEKDKFHGTKQAIIYANIRQPGKPENMFLNLNE